MFNFIPYDFLWLMPLYWKIPFINLWIWQFFNLAFLVWFMYILYIYIVKQKTYSNWLVKKHSLILLDGKTWSWKTRLLTQLWRDAKKQNKNVIVVSNFFSWYWDLFFWSKKDFQLLQIDIARLWEQVNFSIEEKKEIEKHFPWYFWILEKDLEKKVKKIKNKYDILTLADEWYRYFDRRNFMSNFAKEEWQTLLLNLHQTRHSNQTIIATSQDSDTIDLDFRQLAHNEINTFSILWDLIYWFYQYNYLSEKKRKEVWWKNFKKKLFPNLFINYFEINSFVNFTIYNLYTSYNFVNKYLFKNKFKNLLFKEKIFFKEKILKYNTKFNVKINIDIYTPGLIYDIILKKEKES